MCVEPYIWADDGGVLNPDYISPNDPVNCEVNGSPVLNVTEGAGSLLEDVLSGDSNLGSMAEDYLQLRTPFSALRRLIEGTSTPYETWETLYKSESHEIAFGGEISPANSIYSRLSFPDEVRNPRDYNEGTILRRFPMSMLAVGKSAWLLAQVCNRLTDGFLGATLAKAQPLIKKLREFFNTVARKIKTPFLNAARFYIPEVVPEELAPELPIDCSGGCSRQTPPGM
jgi:hypothetical protein